MDISWSLVEGPVSGDATVAVKDGSNPWWAAVQVRNHRHPIATMEGRAAGSGDAWQAMQRQSYNCFVAGSGLGNTAEIRVTDIFGNTLEQTVPITQGTYTAGAQLPTCAP